MKRMREYELEKQFKIKIEEIKPCKGVYFLKTNIGKCCLKKIEYGVQKLYFVYGAKEHLLSKGFEGIDKYYLNENGEPYALINEDIYTLSNWIEGKECDFKNEDEIAKAAKVLAQLHETSKGYEPPENSKLKTDLGRWLNLMDKRTKSLDKMRDMSKKRGSKTNFEINYIKNMPYYKEKSEIALDILKNSKYIEICKKTEEEKLFCHHDYTSHNIIVNDKVNVIDFDYCKREVRAYDIANFIMKVEKRNNYDFKFADIIIKNYNEISEITNSEIEIIYSFLIFPQRFWRLSNRFFYNDSSKIESNYNEKLLYLDHEREYISKFINEFEYNFCQNKLNY